jgi:hypothetical protein
MLEPATIEEGAFSLETYNSNSDDEVLMDTTQNDTDPAMTLLALRKSYKKTKANLARTISHLGFMRTCTDLHQVPKGLRVTTKCHALLKDMSNVEARFTGTSRDAEKQFLDHLTHHYKEVERALKQESLHIEQSMEQTLARVQNREIIQEHDRMMAQTNQNIEKLETKLEETKAKKQRAIQNPPLQRRRDNNNRPRRQGNRLPKTGKKAKGAKNPPPPTQQPTQHKEGPKDHAPQETPMFSAGQMAQLARMFGANNAIPIQQGPPQPLFPPNATPWPPSHQQPQLTGLTGIATMGQPSTLAHGRLQGFC